MTPERKRLAEAIQKVDQWNAWLRAVDEKLNVGWAKLISIDTDIGVVEEQLAKLPPRTDDQRALDETMGRDPDTSFELLTARLEELRAESTAQAARDRAARAERRRLGALAAEAGIARDKAVEAVLVAEGVALLAEMRAAWAVIWKTHAALNQLGLAAPDDNWQGLPMAWHDFFWADIDQDESLAAEYAAAIAALKSDASAPLPGGPKLRKVA